jgi:urease beta subunit
MRSLCRTASSKVSNPADAVAAAQIGAKTHATDHNEAIHFDTRVIWVS